MQRPMTCSSLLLWLFRWRETCQNRRLGWGSSPWPQRSTGKTGHSSNVDLALQKGQCFEVNVFSRNQREKKWKKRMKWANFILDGFVFCLSKSVDDVIGRKQSTNSQSVTRVFKRPLFVQQDFWGLEESTKESVISTTLILGCLVQRCPIFPKLSNIANWTALLLAWYWTSVKMDHIL